ncbi:MAG TPA: methionyl-tRNA formyltransferase [Candidatus Saccharimonadales bacterium]|nr:methionyl-tRNA formyltransferase [Candidatus Saccharimonadales bacterium]
MKVPTIFFGASNYVLPLIEFLSSHYDLKLVVTTEKSTGVVPSYCIANNIPYLSVHTLKDAAIQSKLASLNTSFAILADFGLLIPQSVLDIFPKGIINIHPSLLPELRGPTPGTSAILHGKTTTGVTIMLLDHQLDHGPLLGQVESEIKPDDTSATLYPRLFQDGTSLLKKLLPDYLEGKITPQEQEHTKATFTEPHLTRESGFIDFDQPPTLEHDLLERKIRAYFPWPGVWTKVINPASHLNGKIIKLLPKNLLQVEGKKPMSPKDFLNGYPEMKDWIEKIIKN